MVFLKQSTAATLRVGSFVDVADGATPETGVTLSGADQAELLKATGATVDISGATWAAITGADGWYDLSLTTSHTDTVGMLTVVVQDVSVCLPVWVRAMVLPANAYDALVAGTDVLQADVTQWLGTAAATPTVAGVPEVDATHWNGTAVATPDTAGHPKVTLKTGTGAGELSVTSGIASVNPTQIGGNSSAATKLALSADTMLQFTVDDASFSPTTTEFETSTITEATADHFRDRIVIWTSGALQRQQGTIEAYSLTGGKGHFTLAQQTEAPANGDTGIII